MNRLIFACRYFHFSIIMLIFVSWKSPSQRDAPLECKRDYRKGVGQLETTFRNKKHNCRHISKIHPPAGLENMSVVGGGRVEKIDGFIHSLPC